MARDLNEWKRDIERKLVALRGMSGVARDIAAKEIAKDREEAATGANRPTAPIELTYETAFYIDPQGRRRSRFLMDFPDVTKNIQAEDIEIAYYELWGRDETRSILEATTSAVAGGAAPGLTLPGLAATTANQQIAAEPEPWRLVATNIESFFRVENFYPGSFWRFRVRALSGASPFPGDWSEEISLQMHEDLTPPPQLTAPILSVDRGVISARWDGMTVLGTTPPADFKYAVLAHGTESSPTHEIVRFSRGGGTQIVAAPYYIPQFFRLAAVDESGNMGPWSEQATAVTTPLVDTDVILSEIDAAETHLKNIDAGVSILPDTIISEHIVVTQALTGRFAQFLEVNAGMLKANEIWADTAWLGYANAHLIVSDAFEGKTFTGGEFTGSVFRTDVAEYTGVRFDTTGLKAWSPGGVQTFGVDAATGKVLTTGRFQSGTGNAPYISIIPAEDSYNSTQLAVLLARDSNALNGNGAGGMWVVNATDASAQRLNLRGMNGGGVSVFNSLKLDGSSGILTSMNEIMINSANDVVLDAGTGNTVRLTNGGGSPYAMTSSAPANVYMHSSGQLFKSTSSLRYKNDVQEWSPEYRALGLNPSSWVDRTPVDPADPLQRYYGLIAEQVADVMPELATFNEFGEPDAVQYERLAVALIPILRDMHERLTRLETP
jgi:hypothetical protein